MVKASVHAAHWPRYSLETSLLVWVLTSGWSPRFVEAIRGRRGRPRQIFTALFCLNAIVSAHSLVIYPDHLVRNFRSAELLAREPQQELSTHKSTSVEYFATNCCQLLPRDARILLHARNEGLLLAYELYPRRVFMLPSESCEFPINWRYQPWHKDMEDDPVESYWRSDIDGHEDRAVFIREHGITHEVFFDADEAMNCRWGAVR